MFLTSWLHSLKGSILALLAALPLLFTSLVQAQAISYAFDFENLEAGDETEPPGDLNQPIANASGWYGSNPSEFNRVTVSNTVNSPWDEGGSQSAAIVRVAGATSNSSLYHLLTSRYPASLPDREVTGSVGSPLIGDAIVFAFDVMTPHLARTQPKFVFNDDSGTTAFEFQMRHFGHLNINGADDPSMEFLPRTWYRFEVSNVDIRAGTWDLEIFIWTGSSSESIYTASGLSFLHPVPNIENLRVFPNSENRGTIYFDNFSMSYPEDAVGTAGSQKQKRPVPRDSAPLVARKRNNGRPNIIFIVMDDLNDSVEGFGGHPQAQTPHIDRLAQHGVRFLNAAVPVPLCGPSRASFLTGLQPFTTGYYSTSSAPNLRAVWDVPLLASSRTWVRYYSDQGYDVEVHGKVYHNTAEREEDRRSADRRRIIHDFAPHFGPYPYPEEEDARHPRTPYARGISGFGKLSDVPPDGWSLNRRPFRYESEDDRDLMPDEIYAGRAEEFLASRAASGNDRPFFLNIGILRPHEPFIVPDEYFDPFPLDEVELAPGFIEGDLEDISPFFWRDLRTGERIWNNYGFSRFRNLIQHGHLEEITQAYLASVYFADAMVGRILTALENSPFHENTLVIVTSDNGYHIGEKEYFHKLTPWERSVRVPLVIAGPGVATGEVTSPVSLVDLFSTFLDLTDFTEPPHPDTPLDGHSLRPLLEDPQAERWTGPAISVSAIPSHRNHPAPFSEPELLHNRPRNSVVYSARSPQFRYIIYPDGSEELYDMESDPHEWTNLAHYPKYSNVKESLRSQTEEIVGVSLGNYFEPGTYNLTSESSN